LSSSHPPLLLSSQERQLLQKLIHSPTHQFRFVLRAKILLNASQGIPNKESARRLQITVKTVRKWITRYKNSPLLKKDDASLFDCLDDAPRTGRPPTFDVFFWIDLLSLATSNPKDSQRPITQWTQLELADEVVQRRLAPSIHPTTVGRFLQQCDLKPHQVKMGMNRKKDSDFENKASAIKECLVKATNEEPASSLEEIVVSFDEKTGMQAKERLAEDKPMRIGLVKRIEFEYKRHGTLVLFAFLMLSTGKVVGSFNSTRTSKDTAEVLKTLLKALLNKGYKKIHLVLDQLNTHWSKAVVEVLTELGGLEAPDSKKVKTGALRRKWLSDPDKNIVFHFTPKHASWLNPIEIWFGILVRKKLRYGSFRSLEDLQTQVEQFIDYYNEKMAHPFQFKQWPSVA
jgi:transposase